MFAGFGPTELIIVLVIVLLIFGPKRLPGLGRQIGGAMREFKESVTGRDDDDDEDERRQVEAAPAPEQPAAAQQPATTEPARERTPHS